VLVHKNVVDSFVENSISKDIRTTAILPSRGNYFFFFFFAVLGIEPSSSQT
jgi:hypothetical protein